MEEPEWEEIDYALGELRRLHSQRVYQIVKVLYEQLVRPHVNNRHQPLP
jgi:hypothetical protein